MTTPLLSITMPTRNRPELFEGALSSVLDRVATTGVVSERYIRRWEADYFHQPARWMAPRAALTTLLGRPEQESDWQTAGARR